MLRLNLLGPLALLRDGVLLDWPERGWQRGALLALLGAAGTRGVTRDRLAAWLWPDSDDAAARHSLDELLSRARRDLGEKRLFAAGPTVRWGAGVLVCDVDEFERALEVGHLERAAAMHRGEFAEGLRIGGSRELEQQLSSVRQRLSGRVLDAMERLARRATEQGDHRAAAARWREVVAKDPLRARAVVELLSSHLEAGELVEGLRIAELHVKLARAQIGSVDPAVLVGIERLRASADSSGVVRTPGGPAGELAVHTEPGDVEARRRRLVGSLLGASYRVVDLVEDGTLAATYRLMATDGSTREAHLLQPRVAAALTPAAFDRAFAHAAKLSHPAIVPTLTWRASAEGFVVVCAAHGRPRLRDALRQGGAVPIDRALRIITSLADAIAHAHEGGCVHGDLRPKHIALSGESIMLGGFGFVEALRHAVVREDRSTVLSLGSPNYQSPEQVSGGPPNVVGDVYALGTILFELIAGRLPFGRDGAPGLDKLRLAPPRLGVFRETVPPDLEALVDRALSRHPADRFSSMRAMRDAVATLWPPRGGA
ncbi:MAG: protein kinase [Gemmatimonadaceae bacterium]|nr:protein kinase [Gemmatimonadaceae bacterium]